ncbi:MAG: DUF6288 domain-containing protein, partial [Verrucomicrobiota bacterium]
MAISPVSAAKKEHPIPDLTKGEKPFEETGFNVGPTGFRGWVYRKGTSSEKSRQILVKAVDSGSPADGVLHVGDVILGADGSGRARSPAPFSSDARRTIADAITAAEARDPATLRLLRFREGKTDTVALRLETLGAYADTAPYNCEKSRKILEQGLKAFYQTNEPGTWQLGALVLMAADDPGIPGSDRYQAKAREWVRELIVPASGSSSISVRSSGLMSASKVR